MVHDGRIIRDYPAAAGHSLESRLRGIRRQSVPHDQRCQPKACHAAPRALFVAGTDLGLGNQLAVVQLRGERNIGVDLSNHCHDRLGPVAAWHCPLAGRLATYSPSILEDGGFSHFFLFGFVEHHQHLCFGADPLRPSSCAGVHDAAVVGPDCLDGARRAPEPAPAARHGFGGFGCGRADVAELRGLCRSTSGLCHRADIGDWLGNWHADSQAGPG